MNEKSKKAQEEIVGFVAIVLIVSVIMIVFLGIFLRKDKSGPGNIEVSQFLDALMETTTSCSNNDGFTYKRYSELVELCYEGGDCSGEEACDVLNKYTKEMIENSWKFGDDYVKKGYVYELSFINDEGVKQQPSIVKEGRGPAGTTKFIGSDRLKSVVDGSVVIRLELYLE